MLSYFILFLLSFILSFLHLLTHIYIVWATSLHPAPPVHIYEIITILMYAN
jgi:hypothetical protein